VRRVATLVALVAAAAAVTTLVAVMTSAGAAGSPPRAAAAAKLGQAAPRPSYYLALGDSLAQGVQPDAAGTSAATGQGYADQLYAALHRGDPGLRLVKLGCDGETTGTMIGGGGLCRYAGGSQLAAAVSFLRAHRGQVSLITMDIGANDPDSCITRPSLAQMAACVTKSFPTTVANLTKVMYRLRAAAGDQVRVIGMNYYVPALAEWRDGLLGQAVARVSERVVAGYNRVLTTVYEAFGARVADVFGAFHSGDFAGRVTVPEVGTVPRNVAAICRWTWECAPPPRGPNVHARAAGYGVIARAFLLADRG